MAAHAPRWASSAETVRRVLSRLDGALDVGDIAALSGVSEEEVSRILAPLIASGVVALGGQAAPAGPTPLSEDEHRRITDLYARLNRIDHYRLLGVAATADAKEIKRAYFALAKLHHPDRFYTRDVGPLRAKIDAIFAAMTTALETLTDKARRAEYDAYLRDVLRTRLLRRQAEALEARGDWAAAAAQWARVVEALPTDAFVHHKHGYASLRAGGALRQAHVSATRAVELDPQRAEYRVTAAAVHLALGRDRSALAELEVARELDPDAPGVAAIAAALSERLVHARG